jgi:hypothetical protein
MIALVVTSGPRAGDRLEISRECTLGREGTDVELDDPEASRRHLRVRPLDDGLEIEDLGSLNGTRVDGQRIDATVLVRHGAEVRIGTTTMIVELPAPPADATRIASAVPDADATVLRMRPELQPTMLRAAGQIVDVDGTVSPERPAPERPAPERPAASAPPAATPQAAPDAPGPAQAPDAPEPAQAPDAPEPAQAAPPRPFMARLIDRLLRRKR